MYIVNKNFLKFIMIVGIFSPTIIFSASVQIKAKSNVIHVGDTVVLDVVMDSEKTTLNLVEGGIKIEGSQSLEILELSHSGSQLTLWPTKPSISVDGKNISFVGGTPNGFNSNNASLFKVILVAKTPGKVTLSPSQVKAYINDGRGTVASVNVKNLEINILEANKEVQPINEWASVLSEDKTPPEKFSISLGQDSSVYNNQKFIFFSAEDLDSGVDYYEVKEGNLEKVRSSNTYVLKEQDKDQVILISAIDKAGNMRTMEFKNSASSKNIKVLVIIVILSFFILFIIARMISGYIKRNKNK